MLIALQNFHGERPIADARLLGVNEAQIALNCKLWGGKLKPWYGIRNEILTANPDALSIYGYQTNSPYWLHWSSVVDVVRGPIAETTRLYWTGDGGPKVGNLETIAGRTTATKKALSGVIFVQVNFIRSFKVGDEIEVVQDDGNVLETTVTDIDGHDSFLKLADQLTADVSIGNPVINLNRGYPHGSYALGVPAPSLTPTVTVVGGGGDPEDQAARSYVYTFVATIDSKDMEGQPSPASPQVNVADGEQVDLMDIVDPATLNDGRPYTKVRIYRTAVGSVATEFLFVAEIDAGITTYTDTVPGTSLAEVLPSADWEVPPEDMVNLTELPNGVFAASRGNEVLFCEPYQPHAWPTKYRRTVPDKVVAIGSFGASIIVGTNGRPTIMTGESPESMVDEYIEVIHPCLSKRGMVDMGYAVLYPSKTGLVLVTVGLAEVITGDLFSRDEWTALKPESFVAARYDDRYICFYQNEAGRGGFILDPKTPGATLTKLSIHANAVWSDPETDDLYVVIEDENGEEVIAEWNGDINGMPMPYTWRSKEFVSSVQVMMGVLKVDADAYPVRVNLFMDGLLFDTVEVHDEDPVRCSDEMGKGRRWEIEVVGDTDVESVYVATSMSELTRYQSGAA